MQKVKVLSDSTCDLSKELLEEYSIDTVPLNILMGEASYKDGVDVTSKEIFDWSDMNHTVPKTSAVSMPDTYNFIKKYVDEGYSIIYTGIGSTLSATYSVLQLVREEFPEADIRLIDSKNLSTGTGLLVMEAAVMAKNGFSAEEIEKRLQRMVPLVRATFVVDTPVYLHRGGRCSSVAAFAAGALNIKPMISVKQDGTLAATKKFRGKLESVMKKYVKHVVKHINAQERSHAFVTHTFLEGDIPERVAEMVRETNLFDEVYVTDAGGVISSHCGPGTLGVLYVEQGL